MPLQDPIAQITKLAQVDSAKLIGNSILINPPLLEVVAQRSGFNWELKIVAGSNLPPIVIEYWPYYVVETQDGPGWPPHAGIGPVIPPTTLYKPATQLGTKGIVVIGKDFQQTFDYHGILEQKTA